MPWQRLQDWLSGRRRFQLAETMPLTLVTLAAMDHAEAEEVAFYSDAEFDALVEWARMGRFILALTATDRPELTLLCVEGLAEITDEVRQLPLVSAGLASFDIRVVMPLRLIEVGGPLLH